MRDNIYIYKMYSQNPSPDATITYPRLTLHAQGTFQSSGPLQCWNKVTQTRPLRKQQPERPAVYI